MMPNKTYYSDTEPAHGVAGDLWTKNGDEKDTVVVMRKREDNTWEYLQTIDVSALLPQYVKPWGEGNEVVV